MIAASVRERFYFKYEDVISLQGCVYLLVLMCFLSGYKRRSPDEEEEEEKEPMKPEKKESEV